MNKAVRIAFVGAGYMAEEHLKVFSSFNDIEITGIFSRTIEKSALLQKNYKIKNLCNSIKELYEKGQPQLLIICVPPLECKSICEIAFKYKWKILIEKPVGINLKEAKDIINHSKLNNTKGYVALNRRFYSSTTSVINKLKKFPEQRLVTVLDQEDTKAALMAGYPKKVIENWMYANSIHLIDYFQIFCRGELINVENLINWDLKSSHFVFCKLNFSSGDIGIYQCNWNAPGPWSVTLVNSKIRFEMKPLEQANFQLFGSRETFPLHSENFDSLYKPGLYMQAREAIKAANNKTHKLVSINEGYKTMKAVSLIYNLF